MQACSSHTLIGYHITYTKTEPHSTYLICQLLGIWMSNYQSVVKMKRSIIEVTNNTQDLQIQLLSPKGKRPTCNTPEAAGYDLYSSKDNKVPPRTCILVSTDIAIQVPTDTYGRIDPQSGLLITNCNYIGAGVIDKDYRRQIKIRFINHSDIQFLVQHGNQIAHLILEQIKTPDTKTAHSLQSPE